MPCISLHCRGSGKRNAARRWRCPIADVRERPRWVGCGVDRPYMDAPGLPSFQLVMTRRVIAAVHPDFRCGMAAVPDGMRWLAPQSLLSTRGAAEALGFANHGLTCCANTA